MQRNDGKNYENARKKCTINEGKTHKNRPNKSPQQGKDTQNQLIFIFFIQ